MLVVFVLDTSASMNQRCNNGLTLLDCAKSAIEQFHKVRLRDASVRTDKYMLVTCEEGSNAIRVLDKYPFSTFLQAVKGIQAQDLTSIGASLQRVFNFLHLQRLTLDIDKFGQGRYPYSIDPTTILLLTDGTELTSMSGVLRNVSISSSPDLVGAELVVQPFRWDQRVFAIVLRIPAVSLVPFEKDNSTLPHALAMDNVISKLCESTGGKCFIATSWKALLQHIELTAVRLVSSVVALFEQAPQLGSTLIPPQGSVHKVIYVRPGQMQGLWPIPESFFPNSLHPELLPREAHPVICYKPIDADPFIPPNFIYDKYEIENIPFMSLFNKISKGACWQVFIPNSKGTHDELGDPFGFIRLNHGGSLSLFVLPYNYPVLWQLLKQVVKGPGSTVAKIPFGSQWRQDIEHYCASVPPYYGPALRMALKKWGIHAQIVPENMDAAWFTFIGGHQKRIKAQVKAEYDISISHIMTEDQCVAKMVSLRAPHRLLPTYNQISSQNQDVPPGFVSSVTNLTPTTIMQIPLLQGPSEMSTHLHTLGAVNSSSSGSHGCNSLKTDSIFKNPFDVAKNELIRQLINLPVRVATAVQSRKNYLISTGISKIESPYSILAAKMAAREEAEARHSLPVEKMGDFNETLLKQQTPRNPFIEDVDRSKQQKPMFGNPFRQERSEGAEETWQDGMSGPLARGRKKRRRIELLGASPPSSGYISEGSLDGYLGNEMTPPHKIVHELDAVTKETHTSSLASVNDIQSRKGRPLDACDVSGNDINLLPAVEGKENEQVIEEGPVNKHQQDSGSASSHDAMETMSLTGQSNTVAISLPMKINNDPHDVAEFLLTVIRTLRHTRPGNTQKLFEILSIPDFPVKKCSFVEELIQQAYRYNKGAVAKELSHYHSEICNVTAAVGES